MKQNVLVISTSLRKNSNSEILAKEFEKGAKAAGNTVEFISLANKQIGFCIGCLSCLKSKKCFMKDDAANIAEKVQHADVIAFATPIYYYEMCGQMKTLLDRMNPLYTSFSNAVCSFALPASLMPTPRMTPASLACSKQSIQPCIPFTAPSIALSSFSAAVVNK